MLVCSGIDDNYVWPWLIMARSAVINNDGLPLAFVIGNVNSGLSADSKRILELFCIESGIKLNIIDFDLLLNLKTTHQPLTVYSKLLLLDCLDEKFIWVDADCLLMSGWTNVKDYFEVLDSNPAKIISACLDPQDDSELNSTVSNQAFLVAKNDYFNSGLFLADPVKWKQYGHNKNWKKIVMALVLVR